MKRALSAGTALAFLAGCTAATVLSEGQMAINDTEAVVNALEATHTLPVSVGTIAALVIVGLQGLLNAYSTTATTGANTESTALRALSSALTSLSADTRNPTIQNEARTALAALAALSPDSSETLHNQALALAATVLVDYLKTEIPAGYGGTGNATQVPTLLDDAEAHIARLRAR